MPNERILIVEDDSHISRLVKRSLEQTGYSCKECQTGEDALKVLDSEASDLIILDIGLPQMDGLEVCRTIKQNPKLKNIPIIFLTSKVEEVDKIVGLELGADDYIAKPFNTREFVLRVKAVLSEGDGDEVEEDVLTAGPIRVDIPRHTVSVEQKEVEFTPMEFRLLVTFIRRRGRVQTRATLLSDVWDMHESVDTRTVDTHIKRLREKLGKAGDMIETVVGVGYRFKQEET